MPSVDNFFKVLWSNTLKDELDQESLKSEFNHMRQFKFNHKDIKAFSILGVSVGLGWKKIQYKKISSSSAVTSVGVASSSWRLWWWSHRLGQPYAPSVMI